MTPDELMAEACRLAAESVANDWGGPFGAVIARDGEIVARGQNRVLLTGDITCHAEVDAIRNAVATLNPTAPDIAVAERPSTTLALAPRPPGSADPVPARARMLMGMEIYASGAPCPMCLSAIYWARLDAVHFSNDWEDARAIGFDDAFQYEDFALPLDQRRLPIQQLRPDLGRPSFAAWAAKADRHPY
ncbi:nucleoside deaminase [Aquihabitans sp. G128]|uniref:nucleoside deaminase n=1 Tax=Aquihabitans sp. G128 TaxID=2849779 RepID=UPI001C22F35E|nr:nucleoside deaminase [Aquihabitans sp. G128]QXC59607.1 nucleoside deaminase [Aquihabitans sp. G128]